MPRVSVHIVTYHSRPFLETVLRSLEAQSCQDFSILVVDNASRDGSAEYIAHEWPTVQLVRNRENAGFARAHNQAIHFSDSEFVLALNPDVILHEKFLERLAAAMVERPRLGSASGKLLYANGNPQELSATTFSRLIDSTGIAIDRKRFFRDRGAGEEDRGQYDRMSLIFGASGAAAFYRRAALEDAALKLPSAPSQYFDELYHSYKEDVDLAWRLQRLGWECAFIPGARAYHFRTLQLPTGGAGDRLLRHRGRSPRLAYLSYRNQLYTLIKNESWKHTPRFAHPSQEGTMWKDLWWIGGWEFAKMVFLLFTKPGIVFKAWRDIVTNWRVLLERRRQIMGMKSKVKSDGMLPSSRAQPRDPSRT